MGPAATSGGGDDHSEASCLRLAQGRRFGIRRRRALPRLLRGVAPQVQKIPSLGMRDMPQQVPRVVPRRVVPEVAQAHLCGVSNGVRGGEGAAAVFEARRPALSDSEDDVPPVPPPSAAPAPAPAAAPAPPAPLYDEDGAGLSLNFVRTLIPVPYSDLYDLRGGGASTDTPKKKGGGGDGATAPGALAPARRRRASTPAPAASRRRPARIQARALGAATARLARRRRRPPGPARRDRSAAAGCRRPTGRRVVNTPSRIVLGHRLGVTMAGAGATPAGFKISERSSAAARPSFVAPFSTRLRPAFRRAAISWRSRGWVSTWPSWVFS